MSHTETLESALEAYWDAAFREGKSGSATDDGSAQSALSSIKQVFSKVQTELEQYKMDAARYWWLRESPHEVANGVIDVCIWSDDAGDPLRGAELDISIDTAMKATS